MKEGLTLEQMAAEITRQSNLKEDYLVDTRSLKLETSDSDLFLHMRDNGADSVEPLEINQIAHSQIGTHLNIPAKYYGKMLSEYPELLAENVNAWFQREPSKRMVRTMGGVTRAFLSNRGVLITLKLPR